MEINIDINHFAKPVLEETRKDRCTYILRFYKKTNKNRLDYEMDLFILYLEGVLQHTKEFSKESSANMLEDVIKNINLISEIDEYLKVKNYLDDENIGDKFKYLLNTLYKLENHLHINIYKDTPVLKTPEEVLSGIARISLNTIKSLSK